MSHTTKLTGIEIRDEAALVSAINDLKAKGLAVECVRDAVPRMYFANQHGKCAIVMKINDSKYDVGFDKVGDTYVPVFDEWENYVGAFVGEPIGLTEKLTQEEKSQRKIGKLLKRYARNAMYNAAVQQGYLLESETEDAEGNVHLRLYVGA